MQWLKKLICKWAREGDMMESRAVPISVERVRELRSGGMNFTIYTANGGYIMEYHSYDSKTDRSEHHLHILREDQDLGEGIAHVVTFEMLRK